MPTVGVKITVSEKLAFVKRAKNIPNPMSYEERQEIMRQAEDAEEIRNEELAKEIRKRMPLYWVTAMTWIEGYGAESLRESGWNLSWAVAVLGEEMVYG